MTARRLRPLMGMVVAMLLVTATWSWATWEDPAASVVVGVPSTPPTSTTTVAPTTSTPPPSTSPPVVQGQVLVQPAGMPWPAPVPFHSAIPVADHLVFVLLVGSDARPGEDPLRARADSLHLLAANPGSGEGTILGFPRDLWVDIPGHGHGKINSALALGGPDLLAHTVQNLTGLPVDFYAVTGFGGFARLVDEMGGVDVPVPYDMADRFSGANFAAGWHRMSGEAALAFARNRKATPHGDFSRSANQGLLTLSALAKMRGEVGDDAGLHRWVGVLLRHVHLNVPVETLPQLAAAARVLDPDRVANIVLPGAAGRAGGSSVVHLDQAKAAAIFDDLRSDAVVGAASPPTTTSTTTTTPPTTTPPTTTPPPASTPSG